MPSDAPPAAPRRGRPGNDVATVVRVATGLFDRHGYDHTSIGDLARELGVTKSAIYHHVRSKEHLLELSVVEALDDLDRTLVELSQSDLDAEQRLREAVRRSVELLVHHLAAVRVLLAVRGNTEVEQGLVERRRRIDRALAAMARQAVEEGSLRADVDPLLVSRLVFGTVNSIGDWVRPDHDAAALAATVSSLAFDGISRRPHSS